MQPNYSVFCRICRSMDISQEVLVSPCNCKGSLKFVHPTCLEEWLNVSMRTSCEVCLYKYTVVVRRKYNCIKSVRVWVTSFPFRRRCRTDIYYSGLLSMFLLIVYLFAYLSYQFDLFVGSFWFSKLVLIVAVFATMFYLLLFCALCRDNVRMWNNWWKSNVSVKLILNDQLETFSFSVDINALTTFSLFDINTTQSSHVHITNNNIQGEQNIDNGLDHLQSTPDLLSSESNEIV